MKFSLSLILIFAFVMNSFGSPLVFKTTKEIKANGTDFVEIASLDVNKYQQIRISVIWTDWDNSSSHSIRIYGVEGDDIIHIDGGTVLSSKSFLIDTPPTKIRIATCDSGTYKIYIWASQ